MHNRIATDDNMKVQGADVVNCCNLCPSPCCNETQSHLFFQCAFANALWSWVVQVFTHQLDCVDVNSLFTSVRRFRGWSQSNNLLWIATVSCIWIIWYCRNRLRFENCFTYSTLAIIYLKSLIVESSRHSGGFSFYTAADKVILDFPGIKRLPPRLPKAIIVKWQPPLPGWIKANIDGCSLGNPDPSGCGVTFRDSNGLVKGCLAQNLSFNDSSCAELWGAIHALRIACTKKIQRLWLKCDSTFVLQAIRNPNLVPRTISTHWHNCLKFTSSIQFMCTHIYREGNSVADLLAKHGALSESRWWFEPPEFTRQNLIIDNSVLPFYRFLNM
ncbi:uncharacterized protein LOC113315353 [Papaver somniferum]|uniref:uncharacterized protein LOC113315353 n=1 Tax=Papaver somniferum TaxID=3469 RepID=UPI000E6FE3FA|nr:uncharacterized protein LOC113315353 [Papaver somniferum]